MGLLKHTLAGMLAACLIPLAASGACDNRAPYVPLEERYTLGLLFKIEKCGEPISYLFGTIHLAREDVARAAHGAFDILPKVQAAGFELGESPEAIARLGGSAMLYPKGEKPHSLARELGKKRLAHLLDLLKDTRFDRRALEHLRPWAIAIMLEVVGEENGLPLDEKIRARAVSLKKPVFGLETPDDQVQVFTSMPWRLQMNMLKESIDSHDKLEELKNAMLDAYVNQDMKTIESLSDSTVMLNGDSELEEFLQSHMIMDRNITMEQKLKEHLKQQSVIVSVGAMHLMGASGMLHLLEQDGYRITPVP